MKNGMTTAESILAGWLFRDPYFEMGNGFNCIAEAKLVASCATEDEYKRVKRAGMRVALTRKKRLAIWGLWENAQNHADFSEWLDKNS